MDAARKELAEHIVPSVKERPGFVAGYRAEPLDNRGFACILWESRETAEQAAQMVQVGSHPGPGTTVTRWEIREVIERA
jgi:hypothetical protein